MLFFSLKVKVMFDNAFVFWLIPSDGIQSFWLDSRLKKKKKKKLLKLGMLWSLRAICEDNNALHCSHKGMIWQLT